MTSSEKDTTSTGRTAEDAPAPKSTSGLEKAVETQTGATKALDDGSHQAPSTSTDFEQSNGDTSRFSVRKALALAALACCWTNAQAPLYLFAAVPVFIYRDLGGIDHWVWFITAHLLATAAISPFVGRFSDVFGRRWVALAGSSLIIVGQIMCGVAENMDIFIGGMALTGIGTGINEITALAGTAELAPIAHRGYYIAGMILTILPFLPAVMYSQIISAFSSWRYLSILTGGWALVGLVMTALFYHPPAPTEDLNFKQKLLLLKDMDLAGGFLSIAGLALLEVGLLGGEYQYPWTSARVLAPLILGFIVLIVFGLWEYKGSKNPMIPRDLGPAPRTLIMTMIITFISGANFFSVLMLWPSEAYNIYGFNPYGVGFRGMPFPFGILAGCVISLYLLSRFPRHIKWIILLTSCIMTAGCGALASARTDNIHAMYAVLFITGLGVGGIVVPASTIATIIAPKDFIATMTALTISIRIVGGVIGYTVYYNVFVQKLVPELMKYVVGACIKSGITSRETIGTVIELTSASLVDEIHMLPGVTDETWAVIVAAGQEAYARAYPWVYYCSIAFGGVSILASLGMEDISGFIDSTVMVHM
ncbi:fungal trichothecene efflux pump [Sordaria brevicollis]|uniref:Fungal trichothecene efflux pump n=1 Tax=Sordaria brevicollis TaxID=83679 RepID=A0AAE0U9R7_SORBR|nr:fungal trichothecene efflux pump [Sordaria brevicollis]